jgi:Bacterial Ig domain
MKNELFLILVASLFGSSTSSVFGILDAIAFKSAPVIDPLPSGEVPVCGRGSTIVNNTSEPESEPEQYPKAMDILCNVEENSLPWEIQFVAYNNDSDSELTASILSVPSNGQLSVIDQLAGTVEYTPNPDFVGQDHFTYTVNDGSADSNAATVTLDVIPPPG